MILAFLSPYLMGGHMLVNQRKGPNPAPPLVKEDHQDEQFWMLSGWISPEGV